jgi:hypothetical protein
MAELVEKSAPGEAGRNPPPVLAPIVVYQRVV